MTESCNNFQAVVIFCLHPGMEEKNLSNFVVSPDGRFLAFLGAYGNIHLVSSKVTNAYFTVSKTRGRNVVAQR